MRIVQLSDMHLSADETAHRYDVPPWERLQIVLEAVQREPIAPELMVITGDVAHDHAKETYEKLGEQINSLGYDYRVLPGNHDAPELLPRVFGERGGRFEWERGEWCLVGASTHLPGEIGGALLDDEKAWLTSTLRESPCAHKILFLHHPPVSVGNMFFDAVGLKDGTVLCSELSAVDGLELVCFGHIHRPFSLREEHLEYCAAPSTVHGYVGEEALQVAPNLFGYRVIDLDDGGYRTETRLLTPG